MGTFSAKVDKNRRIQLPASWIPDDVRPEFTLLFWPRSGGIDVLPPAALKELKDKLCERDPSPETLTLVRAIGANSVCVTLAARRRLTLPEQLLAKAGIISEAKLVGMVDRFLICRPGRDERDEPTMSEVLQKIESLIAPQ